MLFLWLWCASPAPAVVLHDDGSQVPSGSRPVDAVMGRWVDNASCVAVGPSHVLTTIHQGYRIGSPVVLNGVEYRVAQTYNHPQADMRVARLTLAGQPANLTDYAAIYHRTDEKTKTVVIGGFGMGRGDPLYSGPTPYGYECIGNHNETLRWGANRVDNTSSRTVGDHYSYVLVSDFDATDVAYEASVGFYDSGGGWFVQDAGQWKLIGLTWTVQLHYEPGHEDDPEYSQSWFTPPDYMDAIRVSMYRDWIGRMVAGPHPGDANGDGAVNVSDLSTLANHFGQDNRPDWVEGNFNNDLVVDVLDLAILANNYGYLEGGAAGLDDSFPAGAPGDVVPEPATVSVLAVGILASLLPRRHWRM